MSNRVPPINQGTSGFRQYLPTRSTLYKPFLWIANSTPVQNLVGRTVVKVQNKVVDTAETVVTKRSNPLIDVLLEQLKAIQILKQVKYVNENGSILFNLKEFIDNSSLIINSARNPDGSLIEITKELKNDLDNLFNKIRNARNVDTYEKELTNVIKFLTSLQTAQTGLIQRNDKYLDPILKTYEKYLAPILDSLSETLDPDLISKLKVSLEELLENSKDKEGFFEFFTYSGQEISGFLEMAQTELKGEYKKLFSEIKTDFDEDKMESEKFKKNLNSAIKFLDSIPIRPIQKGPLNFLLDSNFETALARFLEYVGVSKTLTNEVAKIDRECEQSLNKIQERLIPKLIPVKPPQGPLDKALGVKIDEIREIVIKMALTKLMPLGEDRNQKFHEIYAAAKRKHEQNLSLKLEDVFLKELDNEFSISTFSKSFFYQAQYWFHLHVTYPFLAFYINGIVGALKTDLLEFIKLTGEKRINYVFNLVFKPLEDHITTYTDFNLKLPGEKLNGSIDKANEAHFNNLPNLSLDTILKDFVQIVIEKYAPRISWTTEIEARLNEFGQKKVPLIFSKPFTVIKVALIWSSYVTIVFERMINYGVKYFIKKEALKALKVNVFKTEMGEGTNHSRYQYIINRFIRDKLREISTNGGGLEHKPTKIKSSITLQQDLQKIVRSLFKVIPLSIATNDLQDLHKYVKPGILQQVPQERDNLLVDKFSPALTLELLKGMEHFLYDDMPDKENLGLLSEFVWHSLIDLSKTLTADPTNVTETAMKTVETEMHESLRRVVNLLVKEGVKTALDPSMKLQNEINATLGVLEPQTASFVSSIKNLDSDHFSKHQEEWEKLNNAVLDMANQFRDTKVDKISLLGSSLANSFRKSTENFVLLMSKIKDYNIDKIIHNQQLTILDSFTKQFREEEPDERIKKLEILLSRPWISPEFKSKIPGYINFLQNYSSLTSRNKETLELEQRSKQSFELLLKTEKDRLEQLIQDTKTKMESDIEKLKGDESLATWQKSLTKVEITSKDVTNILAEFIKTTKLPVDRLAVPTVMYHVLELLKFKDKSYHWNGVLSRVINAYTTLVTRG